MNHRPEQYAHNYGAIGVDLLERGLYAEAAQAFRCALARDPRDQVAACNLGIALMREEDWEGAEAATREYLRAAPRDALALCRLGIILRRRGDPEGALAVLRDAAVCDGENASICKELGVTCLALRMLPAARLALKRALRIKGGLAEAWVALGRTHEAERRYGLALRVYGDGLRHVAPERRGPLYAAVGLVYARLNDTGSARKALEKAILRGETDPHLSYLLGKIYLRQGDTASARMQVKILESVGSALARRLAGRISRHQR